MVHKTPGTHIWDLAIRTHRLWVMLAESLREQGLDPLQHLGWKNKGILQNFYFFGLFSLIDYIVLTKIKEFAYFCLKRPKVHQTILS